MHVASLLEMLTVAVRGAACVRRGGHRRLPRAERPAGGPDRLVLRRPTVAFVAFEWHVYFLEPLRSYVEVRVSTPIYTSTGTDDRPGSPRKLRNGCSAVSAVS